jgi:hypothetical protein
LDLSSAQKIQLICPHCNTTFEGNLWQLLDLTARPELAESVHTGTHHCFSCPSCQSAKAQEIDAPLLIYERDALPPMQFLPAHTTTPEEDYQQANELVGLFRKRFMDAILPPDQSASHGDIEVPDDLQVSLHVAHQKLQRYHATNDLATLELALTQWQQIIHSPLFLLVPEQFQITVLNDSGSAFLLHYWATGLAENRVSILPGED